MRISFVICTLLGVLFTKAQNPDVVADSIVQSISIRVDDQQAQVDSLNAQANEYLKSSPTITWLLADHALSLAIEINYTRGIADSHYNLGSSQVYDQYAVALEHLQKAYEWSQTANDKSLQANALLSLGLVYQGMNKLDKAIATIRKAQGIAEQTQNVRILSRVHTNLASTYYHADMYDSALRHSRKALRLKEEINNEYGIRLNHLNLGVILAEFDSTIDQGIEHLKIARRLAKDDPIMINDIMANMIWVYSQKDNLEMCKVYLDSAIMGSDTIDNDYTRQSIHRLAKELYLESKDYENAYLHASLEYEIDKKLRGNEVEGKFKILELENENHKKEKQILLLEKRRSNANLKFFYAASVAVVLICFFIIAFRNYQVKKVLLEDLNVKQVEIEEKSHLLDIKNREIEQFVYVASHDLKAPLNTIIGCVDMLKEEVDAKLSDQSKMFAEHLLTSTGRMKRMIESLLEHGRLGKDLRFEEVDLNEIIFNLQEDLYQLIKESDVQLTIESLPVVKGARIELSLLFQNLIANAIKFSSKDRKPSIIIRSRPLDKFKRHLISITDNGIGIPDKRKDKVFKLFERAHGKTYEGSGIGLAHCQKIVKLHNGMIWLDSREGEGTTFYFTLPMRDWTKSDKLLKIDEVPTNEQEVLEPSPLLS